MQVTCECGCGKVFEGQRRSARFASATCRKRASRAPKQSAGQVVGTREPRAEVAGTPTLFAEPESPPTSEFEAATRRELAAVGQADSMLGQQVLIVARRMSSGAETGSALATLSKEHSRLMGVLGAGARHVDPVDEVSRRREEKRARATTG